MSKLLLTQIAALIVAMVGLAMWIDVGLALFVGGGLVVYACERNAPKTVKSGGDG